MNRRLLLSYVGLVLLVLVVLEVPLAVYYSRNERNVLADKVERDAVALGSIAEGAFEQPPEVPRFRLQGMTAGYARQTGGRVLIVSYPRAIAVADSAGSPGASFASRPEIRRRSAATSPRACATRTRWARTCSTSPSPSPRPDNRTAPCASPIQHRRSTPGSTATG